MAKRKLFFFMVTLSTFLLFACNTIDKPSPIIFKLEDKEIPKKFPADMTYNYYISNEAKNLIGEDVYITFKYLTTVKSEYFKVFAVKKTDSGYIVMDGKLKNYTVPDVTKWGYTEPIQLNEQNGQFILNIKNKHQALNLGESPLGVIGVCDYYKCYDEGKRE